MKRDRRPPTNGAPKLTAPELGPPGQPQMRRQELVIHPEPIVLGADGRMTFSAPESRTEPILLARGPGGIWHAVLLPPRSDWELRPERPAIWTPGMPQ